MLGAGGAARAAAYGLIQAGAAEVIADQQDRRAGRVRRAPAGLSLWLVGGLRQAAPDDAISASRASREAAEPEARAVMKKGSVFLAAAYRRSVRPRRGPDGGKDDDRRPRVALAPGPPLVSPFHRERSAARSPKAGGLEGSRPGLRAQAEHRPRRLLRGRKDDGRPRPGRGARLSISSISTPSSRGARGFRSRRSSPHGANPGSGTSRGPSSTKRSRRPEGSFFPSAAAGWAGPTTVPSSNGIASSSGSGRRSASRSGAWRRVPGRFSQKRPEPVPKSCSPPGCPFMRVPRTSPSSARESRSAVSSGGSGMRSIKPSRISGTIDAPAFEKPDDPGDGGGPSVPRRIADPRSVPVRRRPRRPSDRRGARRRGRRSRRGDRDHGGRRPRGDTLECGESGLCMRMFTPIAALWDRLFLITGDGSLHARPMGLLEGPLRQAGVPVPDPGRVRPPLSVRGPLRGGTITVDGSQSSQLLTGLLMALPLCAEDSEVRVENLKSKPYAAMTLSLLARFGVVVESEPGLPRVPDRGRPTLSGHDLQGRGRLVGRGFPSGRGGDRGKGHRREPGYPFRTGGPERSSKPWSPPGRDCPFPTARSRSSAPP